MYTFIQVMISLAISWIMDALTGPGIVKRQFSSNINVPTAEEGSPFPVLFGTRAIRNLNVINPFFYLFVEYVQKTDTAANLYWASFHLGVCLCLDGVKQIWWGNKLAWPTGDPETFAADNETTLYVINPWLWGDWAYGGPGGVDGTVDVLYGESNQGLNSYLQTKLGSNQPYYRGIVSMVFRGPSYIWTSTEGCYIGTAPLLRQIDVVGKRTEQFCDHSDMWYPEKVNIGTHNDMNPAHIVYEAITSPLIGRGKDTTLIGDSFTTTADTLYDEGYGLSIVWDYSPENVSALIEAIEEIVDGKVYWDYDTEKYEFGLFRDNYVAGDLDIYDESDFWIESVAYLSPGRMPSKVIVKWEHRQYEGERIAYDDDISLLARQNGVTNVQEYDYSAFVVDADLANKIAARQQYVFSAMPKIFTLRCLRTMSDLHETDVFKISYPALNIQSMIVRLINIDRGSLANGEVIITCIEDVFGQAYTIYGTPPDPAIDPAVLESNITGDSLAITDYSLVVVDELISTSDSMTLSEGVTINII